MRGLYESARGQIIMKLIVGISGASGAIYGIRLLELLQGREDVETHLIITEMGRVTIKLETDYSIPAVEKMADKVYGIKDMAASLSSGSFVTDGMIVAPCSVRTLSSVARSANDNLLTRAADVTLKERRRLVLLFRETPLHEGHCQLMLDASRMGTVIMPPLPAFYIKPETISDMVDHTVGRVLDFWGLDLSEIKRWKQ